MQIVIRALKNALGVADNSLQKRRPAEACRAELFLYTAG